MPQGWDDYKRSLAQTGWFGIKHGKLYQFEHTIRGMKAYLGVYTARLEMPWVKSLKEKRALVKPAIERLRTRFPVSAARLAGQNDYGWEVVGFSLIGHDGVWVETVLREAADFIAAQAEYEVIHSSWSIEEVTLEDLLPTWAT